MNNPEKLATQAAQDEEKKRQYNMCRIPLCDFTENVL
jgi:hypothetical protein